MSGDLWQNGEVLGPRRLDAHLLSFRREELQRACVQQVPPRHEPLWSFDALAELEANEAPLIATVKKVADDGKPRLSEMRADLMLASRARQGPHDAAILQACDYLEASECRQAIADDRNLPRNPAGR